MVKKFEQLIENLKRPRNYSTNKQTTNSYLRDVGMTRDSLENGVNVKISDTDRIDFLADLYGIDYGEPEKKLYEDNCVPNENGVCARMVWCGVVCRCSVGEKSQRKTEENGEAGASSKEKKRAL